MWIEDLDPLVDFNPRHSEAASRGAPQDDKLIKLLATLPPEKGQCLICHKLVLFLRPPLQEATIRQAMLGSTLEVLTPFEGCTQHQELMASALHLSVREAAEAMSILAKNISHFDLLRNPRNMSTNIVPRMFSDSQIGQAPLSEMHIVGNPDGSDNSIGGRILDPEWIDSKLPGLWKSSCIRLHKGLCKGVPNEAMSSTGPAWLVDTVNACLVPAPKKCSYVALSYVWGDHKTLQVNSANLGQLQHAGTLSEDGWATQIPRTIRDAIGVVKILAERYLWVDSLCVVQDDETHKHTELSKMAAIYANASVTILALQGQHANYGLRGFHDFSEPRNMRQSVHVLAKALKVIRNFVEPDHLMVGSVDPVAKSRGWIYQEEVCSRNKLVFDGDSVRWECPSVTWLEHIEMSSRIESHHLNAPYSQSMFKSSIPDLEDLQSILRDFNNRRFSYPEDALAAFAGISYMISPAFAGEFVSGLPSSFFDIALLWRPQDSISRRMAKVPTKMHCLPSWSWAGWYGTVDFETASASEFIRDSPGIMKRSRKRYITRVLSWRYHHTVDSPGTPIRPTILSSKDTWLEGKIDSAPGWTQHHISENSETPEDRYESPDPRTPSTCYYSHSSHPGYEFWYPIPLGRHEDAVPSILAPYISTKTSAAWFFPAEEFLKNNGYTPVLSLRDRQERWVGILIPHDDLDESGKALQDPTEPVELVEIATGFCKDINNPWPGIEEIVYQERPRLGQWYEYYWCMWIGRTKGIAYRKGLARVVRSVWEEQRGAPLDLILG